MICARCVAFDIFKAKILKPVTSENVFTPHGVTDVDRRKYFTNYNSDLNRRIVEIKHEKI